MKDDLLVEKFISLSEVMEMAETQEFWSVECPEGEPNLFVCIACLSEAYFKKVPIACPTCRAISTFEAFTLDSIKDWGTEDLIFKAKQASCEMPGNALNVEAEPEFDLPFTESSSV